MTIKHDVLNRITGEVQFTAEIDCDESKSLSWKLRLAVIWAIKNKADLRWADLRWADLSYADLSYADLRGADLSYADLSYADLRGADLSYADLRWTDLSEVNLLVFQGLGSEHSTLYAYKNKEGVIEIRTGCYFGDMGAFKKAVAEKHGDNKTAKEYLLMCDLIELRFNGEKC